MIGDKQRHAFIGGKSSRKDLQKLEKNQTRNGTKAINVSHETNGILQ